MSNAGGQSNQQSQKQRTDPATASPQAPRHTSPDPDQALYRPLLQSGNGDKKNKNVKPSENQKTTQSGHGQPQPQPQPRPHAVTAIEPLPTPLTTFLSSPESDPAEPDATSDGGSSTGSTASGGVDAADLSVRLHILADAASHQQPVLPANPAPVHAPTARGNEGRELNEVEQQEQAQQERQAAEGHDPDETEAEDDIQPLPHQPAADGHHGLDLLMQAAAAVERHLPNVDVILQAARAVDQRDLRSKYPGDEMVQNEQLGLGPTRVRRRPLRLRGD